MLILTPVTLTPDFTIGQQYLPQYDCPRNAVVTCEIKLFQHYFSLRRRPNENTILFQRVKTCPKLFQNYFRSLLQLTNIFQHVQCRRNTSEINSAAEIILFRFRTWLHVK